MDKLPNLISSLHSANGQSVSWQQFAHKAAEFFAADGCLFSFREIKRPDSPIAVGIAKLDDDFAQQIISTTSKSPYYQKLRNSPVGKIICNGDISTDPQIGLARYYGDVLRSEQFDQVMGAIAYRDDKYEASLSIARSKDKEGFDHQEQRLFSEFMPHLGAMIELYVHHYIHPQNADIGAFIDQFSQSLAVVDANANILHSNFAFDKLKQRKSLFYSYGGKVHFYDKSVQQWVDQTLEKQNAETLKGTVKSEIKQSRPSIFRIKNHESSTILKLSVFNPKSKPMIEGRNPRFVLSVDNYDTEWLITQYKELFNLTKAEAELAADLSQGITINQLAIDKELSKHTLRTQLKSIFMKTDTHSQNELIVLLKNVV